MKRVVYLANTQEGVGLGLWLREEFKNDCKMVRCQLFDRPVEDWSAIPDYDLGIGFLYSHKIPKSEFERGKVWVNFHPAPLPEYRGGNVAYHALMNGEREYGATIHYMSPEFDTGDIIEVSCFPIEPHHTAGDLWELSVSHLVSLFKKWVPRLLTEKVEGTPQGEGNYYKKTKIDDVVPLDPEQECLVRALTFRPDYHARVVIGGKSYKIVPEDRL